MVRIHHCFEALVQHFYCTSLTKVEANEWKCLVDAERGKVISPFTELLQLCKVSLSKLSFVIGPSQSRIGGKTEVGISQGCEKLSPTHGQNGFATKNRFPGGVQQPGCWVQWSYADFHNIKIWLLKKWVSVRASPRIFSRQNTPFPSELSVGSMSYFNGYISSDKASTICYTF